MLKIFRRLRRAKGRLLLIRKKSKRFRHLQRAEQVGIRRQYLPPSKKSSRWRVTDEKEVAWSQNIKCHEVGGWKMASGGWRVAGDPVPFGLTLTTTLTTNCCVFVCCTCAEKIWYKIRKNAPPREKCCGEPCNLNLLNRHPCQS